MKQDTLPWKAMHLAVREQGVSNLDFPRLTRNDYYKAMGRLMARDLCTRKMVGKHWHYFATEAQLAAYKNPPMGKPPKPSEQKAAKVLKAKQNISFCRPQPRPVSDADVEHFKAQDANYPVDADGKPLYKITVAPPPPQPLKTNTFTGAY